MNSHDMQYIGLDYKNLQYKITIWKINMNLGHNIQYIDITPSWPLIVFGPKQTQEVKVGWEKFEAMTFISIIFWLAFTIHQDIDGTLVTKNLKDRSTLLKSTEEYTYRY